MYNPVGVPWEATLVYMLPVYPGRYTSLYTLGRYPSCTQPPCTPYVHYLSTRYIRCPDSYVREVEGERPLRRGRGPSSQPE